MSPFVVLCVCHMCVRVLGGGGVCLKTSGGGSADGFFLPCEDLGECSSIDSPPALF